jgi:transcriptional regulator with XRE-family HTH domain
LYGISYKTLDKGDSGNLDKRAEILENLIGNTGLSKKAFAEKIGVPPTTLRSMLERGIGNASVDNVIKVCRGVGITIEELEQMSNKQKTNTKEDLPQLNKRDERDIQKDLEKIINDLSNQNGYAAFDGQDIEHMDEEDKELLKQSLEQSLRIAKAIAKQKFTPKKYRK